MRCHPFTLWLAGPRSPACRCSTGAYQPAADNYSWLTAPPSLHSLGIHPTVKENLFLAERHECCCSFPSWGSRELSVCFLLCVCLCFLCVFRNHYSITAKHGRGKHWTGRMWIHGSYLLVCDQLIWHLLLLFKRILSPSKFFNSSGQKVLA